MTDGKKHVAGCPAAAPNSDKYPSHRTRRNASGGIAAFLLLLAIIALILWLVYRHEDPRFSVVSVSIYALNVTPPPASSVSASVQVTLVTRNSNHHVSILYDDLSAYVSYRNQSITAPLDLPPLSHRTRSTVMFSPVMGGGAASNGVSVPAEVSNGLRSDLEGFGMVRLAAVVTGKLRWKAGLITTDRKSVLVRCDMAVGFRKGFSGQVPLLSSNTCHVYI